MSPLTQTLLNSLLDNPVMDGLASQAREKALSLIQAHFTFSADEITKAYQNGSGYTFIAISVGLDTPDQKFSIFQTLRYSKITRETK